MAFTLAAFWIGEEDVDGGRHGFGFVVVVVVVVASYLCLCCAMPRAVPRFFRHVEMVKRLDCL